MLEVEGLSDIDEDGRSVKECGDARKRTVGKLANQDGVDVQLNANGSAKYTESCK